MDLWEMWHSMVKADELPWQQRELEQNRDTVAQNGSKEASVENGEVYSRRTTRRSGDDWRDEDVLNVRSQESKREGDGEKETERPMSDEFKGIVDCEAI